MVQGEVGIRLVWFKEVQGEGGIWFGLVQGGTRGGRNMVRFGSKWYRGK